MMFLIQTIPRGGNVQYLRRTVDHLMRQFPGPEDLYWDAVGAAVVNLRPGQHAVFDSLRQDARQQPLRWHGFHFLELQPNRCDPPRCASRDVVRLAVA